MAAGKGKRGVVYGHGQDGQAFYSKQAWLASRAHALAQGGGHAGPLGPGTGGPAAGGGTGSPAQPTHGNPNDSGWSGLQGVIQALGGQVTPQQLANMQAGATGTDGAAIGGMKGAMGGLSPQAMEWLANSGLLQKTAGAAAVDTTGLTGTDLLLANIHNTLNSQAAPSYSLAPGVNAQTLQGLLQQAMGQAKAPIFAHGYGNPGGGAAPLPGSGQ